MIVKLLTEHHLEFLSFKGGCRGSSESTLVKMLNCWKSHVTAQIIMPSVSWVVSYCHTFSLLDEHFSIYFALNQWSKSNYLAINYAINLRDIPPFPNHDINHGDDNQFQITLLYVIDRIGLYQAAHRKGYITFHLLCRLLKGCSSISIYLMSAKGTIKPLETTMMSIDQMIPFQINYHAIHISKLLSASPLRISFTFSIATSIMQ